MLTVPAQRIIARLDAGLPIVLDGSVEAAMERAGLELSAPLFSASVLSGSTHVLSTIHQRYCAAGVHVLRTNTAHTTPSALSRGGYGYRAAKLSSLAADLAIEAVESSGKLIAVAGVLPPFEGKDERARVEQVAHAQRLFSAGCDLIFVGPVANLKEAVTATAAATQTELPVLVALRVDERGQLCDGESLEAVCAALAGAGARGFWAVATDPAGEVRATGELSTLGRPWGVCHAGGALSVIEYAERGVELAQEGATLFGGEGFATPEHIRALVAAIPGADRELQRMTSLRPHGTVGRPISNLPPRA